MELVAVGRLTREQWRELEGDEEDPWDAAGSMLQFRHKEQHVLLRDDDGRLVASAGMVVVDVDVGGERFPVVGLGGVIVKAEHRGRGYAREVVTAVIKRSERLGPKFMLLFCHADRAGLYRKLGFTEVGSQAIVEQPDGMAAMPMLAMWRALSSDATWPKGDLTVLGLPF